MLLSLESHKETISRIFTVGISAKLPVCDDNRTGFSFSPLIAHPARGAVCSAPCFAAALGRLGARTGDEYGREAEPSILSHCGISCVIEGGWKH